MIPVRSADLGILAPVEESIGLRNEPQWASRAEESAGLSRPHRSRSLGTLLAAIFVPAIVIIVLVQSGWAGSIEGGASSGNSKSSILSATVGSQEWPTYLGNDLRTSNDTTETWLNTTDASSLATNWSFSTSGVVASSTTVYGGTAYFGSWDGYEYAVNVTTGQLTWKTFLGIDPYDTDCGSIGITSAPTVSNGVLYLGGNNATGGINATWYALSASTGAILWSIPIGNMSEGYYNWASPLIYDNFAYVGVASECDKPLVQAGLIQVNLTEHRIQTFFHTTPYDSKTKQYKLGASIWSSPSVDPSTGVVFASTGNPPGPASDIRSEPYSEAILAFNATNISRDRAGKPGLEAHWQIPVAQAVGDGDFGAGPTVLQKAGPGRTDLVVAGNKDGYVYALNASKLSTWTVHHGHLGTLWETKVPMTVNEIISPASYGGGLVYFTTPNVTISGTAAEGSVWALRPSTGAVVWYHTLSGRGIGAPLYANGVLIVAAGQSLWEYVAATGSEIQEWEYSGDFVSAISIAEGRVFAGNENHDVYALCVPSVTCTATPQP